MLGKIGRLDCSCAGRVRLPQVQVQVQVSAVNAVTAMTA